MIWRQKKKFSEYFGFSDSEVDKLFERYQKGRMNLQLPEKNCESGMMAIVRQKEEDL